MSEGTKACSLCQRVLPRTDFHKNGRRLAGRCKECTNAQRRALHAQNPSRQREATSRYAQRHPEKIAACKARWVQSHREQYLAYQRAYYHGHTKEKRRQQQQREQT